MKKLGEMFLSLIISIVICWSMIIVVEVVKANNIMGEYAPLVTISESSETINNQNIKHCNSIGYSVKYVYNIHSTSKDDVFLSKDYISLELFDVFSIKIDDK